MAISITLVLIIMTGLISYQAFSNADMRQKLMFHPYTIRQNGEYHRFLTHGFVHANWQHLLINMFVFWQFGTIIEYYFDSIFGNAIGPVVFVVFYLSGFIISAIPAYFQHQSNPSYAAVGASGATSAMLMAYVFFGPWEWFVFPPLPAIVLAIGYLWYSSYMEKRGNDNIAHGAHFWGAVYGVLFIIVSTLAFKPVFFDYFVQELFAGPTMPFR
jgi:membrane associated rhomboid family serine protease